jgi:hypothetical protein
MHFASAALSRGPLIRNRHQPGDSSRFGALAQRCPRGAKMGGRAVISKAGGKPACRPPTHSNARGFADDHQTSRPTRVRSAHRTFVARAPALEQGVLPPRANSPPAKFDASVAARSVLAKKGTSMPLNRSDCRSWCRPRWPATARSDDERRIVSVRVLVPPRPGRDRGRRRRSSARTSWVCVREACLYGQYPRPSARLPFGFQWDSNLGRRESR